MLHTPASHSEATLFAPQYQDFHCIPRPLPSTIPSPASKALRHFYKTQQSGNGNTHVVPHKRMARTSEMMMRKKPLSKAIRFDRPFLDQAKRCLEEQHHASHHFDYCKDKPVREAAVFMPLCVVSGVPSVLFTIRANNMRNHRGECSFPGGKRDPTDSSCLATALREMEEEVFIRPDQVEVLGEYPAMPNKDCTMRVQPYVGFLREPIKDISQIQFNKDEVQKVFSVPINDLLDPQKRTNLVRFRDSQYMYPVYHVENEDCTVWGLTAFILDCVLRRIAKEGPAGAMVCPEGANIQKYKPVPPAQDTTGTKSLQTVVSM
ncbi:nudix (nucleoside diphosphate linked moiety X)-type motif 8 [Podila humilis]|nr:nudix (nucleoside diphosphate linked moiety X)-type motif 8 [Podila humilis]